jgi:hypothetical protein
MLVSSIYIQSAKNGGNGVKIPTKVIYLGPNLLQICMNILTQTLIIWYILPCLNSHVQLNTTSILFIDWISA